MITIPGDTAAGTHELRLFGVDDPPTVRFAITAAAPDPEPTVVSDGDEDLDRAGVLFVAGSALVLLLAAGRLLLRRRGARRAD